MLQTSEVLGPLHLILTCACWEARGPIWEKIEDKWNHHESTKNPRSAGWQLSLPNRMTLMVAGGKSRHVTRGRWDQVRAEKTGSSLVISFLCSWFPHWGGEQSLGIICTEFFSLFFFNFSQITYIFSMFSKYNKIFPVVNLYLRYKYLWNN